MSAWYKKLNDYGPVGSPSRLQKAGTNYALAIAAYEASKHIYAKIKYHLTHTVSVNSGDAIYKDLQEWLLDLIPNEKRKSLLARYVSDGKKDPLAVFYDGHREQSVIIGGHKVSVAIEKDEPRVKGASDYGDMESAISSMTFGARDKIVFVSFSLAGRDAVLNFLAEVAKKKRSRDNPPGFWLPDNWNGWDRHSQSRIRPLETVTLKGTQLEDLVEDLDGFRSQGDFYARWGMPYHRCYLFHGPPGTGKTSIARALSGHFGMDLYCLSLGDLKADAKLMSLVTGIGKNSLLLLEDVDVFHAAKHRDEAGDEVSLSGLMNALDGAGTPDGLVTIMTTNDMSVLDDALIRPGRVDRILHINYMDQPQFVAIMTRFYGDLRELDLPVLDGLEIAPSDIFEAFKRYPHDAEAMIQEINQILNAQTVRS